MPVHLHDVVQPVTAEQMAEFGAHGPALQVEQFARGERPATHEIEAVAERARRRFATVTGSLRPP